MKKQIVIALALMVSAFSFGQKDELKAAEKALKSNNFADAKASLMAAESLIGSADDRTKAKYYYLLGQALYANGTGSNDDINASIEKLIMAKDIEVKSGKTKYLSSINKLQEEMLASTLKKANSALKNKKYMVSSAGFNQAYRMSPKDTLYLYYAATTAVTAKDYDVSLKYYEELRDLKYSGDTMEYFATNKESGKEEVFDSKQVRDFSVKQGTHILPKDKKAGSKSGEIIKNIALIYISQGNDDKALDAIAEARAKDPDDVSLIISEANIALKMEDNDKFKRLMEEATKKDPNNATLQYNIGVMTMREGEFESARQTFYKALELDPTMKDAALNISTTYIEEGNVLVEEMNELGTSAADFDRYDELKAQKEALFRKGAEALEEFLQKNPSAGTNDLYQQLNNIYLAVGDSEKAKMYKDKIQE